MRNLRPTIILLLSLAGCGGDAPPPLLDRNLLRAELAQMLREPLVPANSQPASEANAATPPTEEGPQAESGTANSGSGVAHGEKGPAKHGEAEGSETDPTASVWLGDKRASLGQFDILVHDPSAQSTLQVEFRLEGRVVSADAGEFLQRAGPRQRRLREQVLRTIREATSEELKRPDAQLLARKVAAGLEQAIDEPLFQSLELIDLTVSESIEGSSFTTIVEPATTSTHGPVHP